MTIAFADSARSTLGVEWELAIIDNATQDLAPLGPDLVQAAHAQGLDERVTHELLLNTVEIVTGVNTRVADAVADLDASLGVVEALAKHHDAALTSAGTHPFATPLRQAVTPSQRYTDLVEKTQWWGRNMLIYGVHVHVGVPEQRMVIPLVNALSTWYPHILAISTSSPWWEGINTGYASNRTMMFQQLPSAGLPAAMTTWSDYEEVVEDLLAIGTISQLNELRWDVRPSPALGTIELRFADGVPTLSEVGAIAALSQCFVDWGIGELSEGRALPVLKPWQLRENKWRAARYGLDTAITVDRDNTQRPLRDDLEHWLEVLAPVAKRLNCQRELDTVRSILHSGTSGTRQLAIASAHENDLREVVRSLVSETQARWL